MISKVLLIGAGQMGIRHLQGIAISETPYIIWVVEPSLTNRQRAAEKFQEISNSKIHFIDIVSDIVFLPKIEFDIAIISTNADIRSSITKKLLQHNYVKFILFEKVAFQSEQQFNEILALLNDKGIKGWVNCPRRFFSYYQTLRKEIIGAKPVKMIVEGIDWGLACNSVHFMDLFSFITGEIELYPKEIQLNNKIYESKRKGFIEFYGSIGFLSNLRNELVLICNEKSELTKRAQLLIKIWFKDELILINEIERSVEFYKNNELIPIKINSLGILFQSELTHLQIKEILQKSKSILPSLQESFEIHRPLLKILKEKYEFITKKTIISLPIT